MVVVNEKLPVQAIVLISGKAGVGKSHFAQFLLSRYRDEIYKHVSKIARPSVINTMSVHSFATKVKETARLIGWDGEKDEKGRRLLQDIGSTGRRYDEDLWVKLLLKQIIEDMDAMILPCPSILVVDDWRFMNELDYFDMRSYNTVRVRVYAPDRQLYNDNDPLANDISEIDLPEWNTSFPEDYGLYNVVVDNRQDSNISFEEYYKKVVERIWQ